MFDQTFTLSRHLKLAACFAAGLCIFSIPQAHANPVLGYWASDGSIIHITETEGNLSAIVVALMEPNYTEGEEYGPVGAPRRDDLNPEEARRTDPVLGLELLKNYTYGGKRWEGKIYDPESGNTYSSRMEVDRKGNLKMRGYIGVPMLGRTAIFEPVSSCKPHIREMLAKTPSLTDQRCDPQ
ncbi:MAG: DUF2147 domain-containing protein [Pseudomonadota bacterium]